VKEHHSWARARFVVETSSNWNLSATVRRDRSVPSLLVIRAPIWLEKSFWQMGRALTRCHPVPEFAAVQARALFRHCPRCGRPLASPVSGNALDCAGCGFRYFFNPAVAVAVFITRSDDHVLLIRRAKEPAKDRLAPPGGFIDFDERAEDAVRREIREEIGLELAAVRFLSSQPNAYFYREVTYPVLDLFFVADAASDRMTVDAGEVAAVDWHPISNVRSEDLAFPSMQVAWRDFLESRSRGGRP
jgi:ADP-ribose pyrophosphatase YjhB (NUDIX family)